MPREGVDRFVITAFGKDQPGIVRRFSQYLAGKDINIVDLYGDRKGEEFVLIGQLEVPVHWDIRLLQADLEQMGQELGFTVQAPARKRLRGHQPAPADLLTSRLNRCMLRTDEILSTIQMLHAEHLDVRAVTLALNVDDCAAPNVDHLCRKLRQKIARRASRLVEICNRVGAKYGIPVTNKRLAISPASTILAGHGHEAAVQVARTLDKAAAECGVDFVGGFTALVHKGISAGRRRGDESPCPTCWRRPSACARRSTWPRGRRGSTWTRSTRSGTSFCASPQATADRQRLRLRQAVRLLQHSRGQSLHGRGLHGRRRARGHDQYRRLGARAWCASASKRRLSLEKKLTLGDLAEEIKITSFRVTRVGELIGREVAAELGLAFGIVDLSLAPTPTVGDSVGEILKTLGIAQIGAPGSTAAIAMLTDAVKKGGACSPPARSAG